MSLNDTPRGERVCIGFFGKRNAGKSSLVNAFTGQTLSIVSDVLGTTTDPVYKAMELLPLGPVEIVDTPGFDDEGELGKLRIQKCLEVMRKIDAAIIVIDSSVDYDDRTNEILSGLKERNIPTIIALNKSDIDANSNVGTRLEELRKSGINASILTMSVSALNKDGIDELKTKAAEILNRSEIKDKELLPDCIEAGDIVVLVVPIDSAAPKGRLILPQQQTIRALLERGALSYVTTVETLKLTLDSLKAKPKLVVTDSQAFGKVSEIVPSDVLLTGFSVLFAKYKGDLDWQTEGAKALDDIKDSDKILIAEGCTHHRQCGDIGTVKLPNWIRKYTGCEPEFTFVSGGEFMDKEKLSQYKLVIHCGGCMLNPNEMLYRVSASREAGVPITNYGIAIAKMHGILDRSLEVFKA